MGTTNIVNLSGGKDSTALALLAVERAPENIRFVFADTGHEHPLTYEYVDYLDGELRKRCGVGIEKVRADFSQKMREKAQRFKGELGEKWRSEGISQERIDQAIEILENPTGNPFLDMAILAGRFPTTKRRFCSQRLKHDPIDEQVIAPALRAPGCDALISWQGVRADESASRKDLPMKDVEFGTWEPEPKGHLIFRPIIKWTAKDVFDFHKKHNVKPNPLYKMGMSRVGCMPCIHARKSELGQMAKRFPEVFDKLHEWELELTKINKQGKRATFFKSTKTPGGHAPGAREDRSSAYEVKKWATGGGQFDLFEIAEDGPSCSSVYGLCE